ncbi:glucosamine-6-phosphate deaminase [Paenibacillus antri]|uniref:Glucosamine-6-phosphate deaminase n=1 Tax=Paenibacillus antri TaxID=2582848 RepID=A0A5R9GD31_9BACL|nr:glucosamine-6-phosphate deaminase [Paenibacillus antri]TLS51278.1 glucosamine-6-phosphate deaminase [Paenibacillus antri]
MELMIESSYDALSESAARLVETALARKSDALICLPTGHTPLGLFRKLTESPKAPERWRGATVVALDEYLGVRPEQPHSLIGWLRRELLDGLEIGNDRLLRVDPVHPEPSAACAALDREIEERGGIELTVLGLGPNGHIGFNEPGTAADSATRVVRLAEASIASNAAYWKARGGYEPEYGLTLGMGTILRHSKTIALLVSGAHKADIFQQFLRQSPSPAIPATLLKQASRLIVLADEAAAGKSEIRQTEDR